MKLNALMPAFSLLILLLAVLPGVAQENNSGDILVGEWEGSGMLMGSEASFIMRWSRELNNQFLKLDFTNSRALGNGEKTVFNAQGFYKIDSAGIVAGTWFDSRGITFPLSGKMDSTELTILWGSTDTEQGKTVYKIVSEKEIKVADYILSNGEYRPFGQATYSKK